MKQILFYMMLFSMSVVFLSSCGEDDDQVGSNCPACVMAPEPGPCLAAIPRFYWDEEEQMCKEFVWGGCGDFPFETLEECQNCDCR